MFIPRSGKLRADRIDLQGERFKLPDGLSEKLAIQEKRDKFKVLMESSFGISKKACPRSNQPRSIQRVQ